MKQMKYVVEDIDHLSQIIEYLRASFHGKVIYLEGNLGVGKTTFAQLWLMQAGVTEVITSPTYAIANHYLLPHQRTAIHADLYRIVDPDELIYLDVREWEHSAQIILIEWPAVGEGYIPAADAVCTMSLSGQVRELIWEEQCL